MNFKGGNSVITMAGMIGIGKTTYTNAISAKLGSIPFFEVVKGNPVLEDFYKDPKRNAFHLQIFFLSSRFQQIKKALQHQNNILDRSIYEDALFCQIQHEVYGNISRTEYQTYLSLMENMMEEIKGLPKKSPDLMVYLRGDFKTVIDRIQKRGRPFEQTENNPDLHDYYRELHSRYDDWANSYTHSPILVIQVENYDLEKEADREAVGELVENKLIEIRENQR